MAIFVPDLFFLVGSSGDMLEGPGTEGFMFLQDLLKTFENLDSAWGQIWPTPVVGVITEPSGNRTDKMLLISTLCYGHEKQS